MTASNRASHAVQAQCPLWVISRHLRAEQLDVALLPKADISWRIHVGIWLPLYKSARPVNSLIQLLDSLAKVINERLQSHMQMITLMLSAVIIYPCHQFFRAFSFRHVGPLRR